MFYFFIFEGLFQFHRYTFPGTQVVRDLRLASIWTGTNEIMSLIIASEWYREYFAKKEGTSERDMEEIAAQADSTEEKVYE